MKRKVALLLLLLVACSPSYGSPLAKCSEDVPYSFALAGNVGLRHNDIWAFDENGKRHRLTRDHASSQPSFSPDGTKIAFVSGRNGFHEECCGFSDLEIWVMNADGSEQTKLTDGPGDSDPAWSPDGDLIAFTRGRHASDKGDIYVMEPDGTNVRLVAEAYEEQNGFPAWSPDGERIAFVAGGESGSIQIVDLDDREIETVRGVSTEGLDEIAWSPDGGSIAFVDGLATHIVDLDSGDIDQVELTSVAPQWLPDGRLAYFDRRQDDDGDWSLWQLTVWADGRETDLPIEPFGHVWDEYTPDWPDCPSPD